MSIRLLVTNEKKCTNENEKCINKKIHASKYILRQALKKGDNVIDSCGFLKLRLAKEYAG